MWKCLREASSTKVFESHVTFILYTFADNVSPVLYVKLSSFRFGETAVIGLIVLLVFGLSMHVYTVQHRHERKGEGEDKG